MEWKSQALEVLTKTLQEIPVLELVSTEYATPARPQGWPQLLARITCKDQPVLLAIRWCHTGEPRYVRQALAEMNLPGAQLSQLVGGLLPVLMAPYFTPRTRAVCAEAGVGCLDLQGNVLLSFGTIYIERHLAGPPAADRRIRRSLFKPQAARMLRAMFRYPKKQWLVAELSAAAQVSLGLVSQLGIALRDKGLAMRTRQGLSLIEPDDLLDTWVELYSPLHRQELELVTALDAAAFELALATLKLEKGRAIYASFSAAGHLCPGIQHRRHCFYADDAGLAELVSTLKLTPAAASHRACIVIAVPDEPGILDDAVDCGANLPATSPVQTYLDLTRAGREGLTAAARLRTAGLWPG